MIYEEEVSVPARRRMPEQKPGRSIQNYATPAEFIRAVKKRWDIEEFDYDLAADGDNSQAPFHFCEEEDSLKQNWTRLIGNLWLNPPFANIDPWAEKCARDAAVGRRIFFLTPASIGANWFANHVWKKARVFALQGRLSFDGKAPYPKDCMLSVFPDNGFEIWDWRKE